MLWFHIIHALAAAPHTVPAELVPDCLHGVDDLAHDTRTRDGIGLRPFGDSDVLRIMGLEGGDILRSVNGHPLTSTADVASVRETIGGASTCIFVLERWGEPFEVAFERNVTPPQQPPAVPADHKAISRLALARALSDPSHRKGTGSSKAALAALGVEGYPVSADGVTIRYRPESALRALWTQDVSTWDFKVDDQIRTVTLVPYGPPIRIPERTPPPWTRPDLPTALADITEPPPFAQVRSGFLWIERAALRTWLAETEVRALQTRGPQGTYDGFRLSKLSRGSTAHRLGLRPGDIVHAIDDVVLDSHPAALAAFERLAHVDTFDVRLQRGDRFLRIPVRLVDHL